MRTETVTPCDIIGLVMSSYHVLFVSCFETRHLIARVLREKKCRKKFLAENGSQRCFSWRGESNIAFISSVSFAILQKSLNETFLSSDLLYTKQGVFTFKVRAIGIKLPTLTDQFSCESP